MYSISDKSVKVYKYFSKSIGFVHAHKNLQCTLCCVRVCVCVYTVHQAHSSYSELPSRAFVHRGRQVAEV